MPFGRFPEDAGLVRLLKYPGFGDRSLRAVKARDEERNAEIALVQQPARLLACHSSPPAPP